MIRSEVPIDSYPMVSLLVAVLKRVGPDPITLLCRDVNALPDTAKLIVESDSADGEDGVMVLSVSLGNGE